MLYDIKKLTLKERKEHGIYYTHWLLADFHVRLIKSYFDLQEPKCLEPSAGKGAYLKALSKHYVKTGNYIQLDSIEPVSQNVDILIPRFYYMPEELYGHITPGTFEEFYSGKPERYDLIVGNPPFNYAQSHIEMAYDLLNLGGVLSFLLRLNFLGGQKRKEFWQKHKPKYIFSLSTRPSFYKSLKSSSDATEYAIYCWEKSWQGRTELIITDWTE